MGFINSTVICNEKKQVDLDVLNQLAAGSIKELCVCSYKNEKRHHHFIYDTDGMFSLYQLHAGLSFENVVELLSSTLGLVNSLKAASLDISAIKNAKEYIFKSDDGFKFIYIPINHRHSVHIKDFFLRLLSVAHLRDVRLSALIKELRKVNDDAAIACVAAFVDSYEAADSFSHAAASLKNIDDLSSEEQGTTLLGRTAEPSDEEGTTLLNKPVDDAEEQGTTLLNNVDGASDEGDTTLLNESQESFEEQGTTLLGGEVSTQEQEVLADENINLSEQIENNYQNTLESLRMTAKLNDESSEYETTVLSAVQNNTNSFANARESIDGVYSLHLIRNLNGEKIDIDVTPFTIGKDSYNMDFVLNNESVSRHHATILYEDGSYFIMDNHSTNGTIIEGIRLSPDEKGEIGNGYIITLGSESFQAHIERR